MSKILLIEPHKILRRAISLSLSPGHEVHVEESLSASGVGSLKEYDLLIVDGAALRENDQLTPEVVRAIQDCRTPTLWLEGEESSGFPKRDKLLIMRKPIEKEAFQSALDGFLSSQITPKERADSLGDGSASPDKRKGGVKKRSTEPSQQADFGFIDLVDVVEEQPSPRQGKKAPRKPK